MSTLRRLKAYFGMVPAEELGDYAGDYASDYAGDHAGHYGGDYRGDSGGQGVRDSGGYAGHAHPDDELEPGYRPRVAGRPSRWSDGDSARDYEYDEPESASRRAPARQWGAQAAVRGALAVDPAPPSRAVAAPAEPEAVTDGHPMSRITTLHPRNYNEARTVGEHYREGIPVIMNLTAMEDADAKRLVDFAAGLAFAMRGSIDKVTTKVFLISPANVDVTAEDRRRIAEGSFLPPHFKRA